MYVYVELMCCSVASYIFMREKILHILQDIIRAKI